VEVVPRVALCECQTLHLDRGYDNGIDDLVCSKSRARGTATTSNNNNLHVVRSWP
jgi:hypothetical protein